MSRPGATPSKYIGTFPLGNYGGSGTCTPAVPPTALTVTAVVGSRQDNAGEAITLLAGVIVGGFGNAGTNLPAAYVANPTGVLALTAFVGVTTIAVT